jgi:hypothetical protein
MLFNSGNPLPPQNFVDYNAFANWPYPLNPVGTKEYRAILYLRDITLRYKKNERTPKIEYEPGDYIGFTPPRLVINGQNISPLPHMQGIGQPIAPDENLIGNNAGVRITHRIEFKLCPWMDAVCKLLTGYWARYASIEIRYSIYKNGQISVDVESTNIPSQSVYIDWQSAYLKDMTQNTKLEIDEFMNRTPGCSLAPNVVRFTQNFVGAAC